MTDSFPPPLPFDCRKVRSVLPQAERDVEGTDDAQEAFMTAHLAECPSCREERDTFRHLEETLRTLPEIATPDDLMERIMAGVEQAEAPVARSSAVLPFRKKLASVAATIALLALGAFLLAERLTGEQSANEITATSAYRSVESPSLDLEHNQINSEAPLTINGTVSQHTTASTVLANDPEEGMDQSLASADRVSASPASPSSSMQPEGLESRNVPTETVVVSAATQRETVASSTGQAVSGALPADSSELAVVPSGEVYNDPVSSLVGF